MNSPIYLDYAATTPVDERVAAEMSKHLTSSSTFGNPSSSHIFGFKADDVIEKARNILSDFLVCKPKEIIFTSGATESNNLAIKGFAIANKDKGNHIITSITEHKAVFDTCRALENEGFDITYLSPNKNGIITPDSLKQAIKAETILVSIMHVNNETGVIQDIVALGNILKDLNIFFHVDAAQSFGKLPIALSTMPIDALSFCAHKIYGPKGIGGLFIRNRSKIKIQALITGGGQEYGIRPGTTPTHQIVGLSKAVEIAKQSMDDDYAHAVEFNKEIVNEFKKMNDVIFNSDLTNSLPNIINVSFLRVESSSLITSLQNDIAISSGSACTSGAIEPSHVIKGMGIDGDRLNSAVRISIGRYTNKEDIKIALDKITYEVERIRNCTS